MAEGGEKRSPTGHRTPSQRRRHNKTYQRRPKQLANKRKRSKDAYELEKKGISKKGDGLDINHSPQLSKSTKKKRKLTLTTPKKNRGHGTSPGGNKKGTTRVAAAKKKRRTRKA